MPTKPADYAKMRLHFLKESAPETYQAWKKSDYLKEHLSEIGKEAEEMYWNLHAQMMHSPDLPKDCLQSVKALEPDLARRTFMDINAGPLGQPG